MQLGQQHWADEALGLGWWLGCGAGEPEIHVGLKILPAAPLLNRF